MKELLSSDLRFAMHVFAGSWESNSHSMLVPFERPVNRPSAVLSKADSNLAEEAASDQTDGHDRR
eukprot:5452623-Pleurochrysis_carterae.AAC.10